MSVDIQSRLRPQKPAGKITSAEAPPAPTSAFRPESLVDEIRHADFGQLTEAVELLKRAPRAVSGFPLLRPSDCRAVTDGLRAYFDLHRARFMHGEPVLPQRFFALLDQFLDSDVRAYPNEVAQVELLRIEALLAAGRGEEALALVAPRAERPYLVEDDFSLLEKTFELDTQARLSTGRSADVERVALGRVLLLARQRRRGPDRLLENFLPGLALGNSFRRQYSIFDFVPRVCARGLMALRLRRRRGLARLVLPVLEFGLSMLGAVSLQLIALAHSRLRVQVVDQRTDAQPDPQDVLVTRAMGGIGDIMMMTPGLDALARRLGRPVHFATKRQFFPLLENNPRIRLLDIDDVLPVHGFARWVNLSFCPASRYEARTTPNIDKGRVELFARAMGIGTRALDRYGWRPVFVLSHEQKSQRDVHRARLGADGLPVIGVQPFSRENYRSYRGIFDALAPLAERATLVYFHTSPVPAPPHPNTIQMHGIPLRQTIAAIAACDYFVSVDSAFFHLAAAFDIPTLGVFGPTSGKIRGSHHPRSIAIEAPESFHCAPCWRTEDQPCQVSRGLTSACLAAVAPRQVAQEVERLMVSHPIAPL